MGSFSRNHASVDLAFYDSPEYFDHLHRATFEAGSRPIAILEGTGSLLQNGITLVSMGLVLIPYGWWLPVALFFSTLPALFVVLRHRQRFHRWSLETTKDERRSWYYHYHHDFKRHRPRAAPVRSGELLSPALRQLAHAPARRSA